MLDCGMPKLMRIAVGYRDDLQLSSRWWHRLFVVAMTLESLAGFLVAFLLFRQPAPIRSNIVILANLRDYNRSHPDELNTFESFGRLDGKDGILWDDKPEITHKYFPLFTRDVYCNANFQRHIPALTKWLREHSSNKDISEDTVKTLVGDKEPDFCAMDSPNDWPNTTNIVKYDFTFRALLVTALKAFSIGLVFVAASNFLLANLYYRGVIYIVFGKRSTQPPASV